MPGLLLLAAASKGGKMPKLKSDTHEAISVVIGIATIGIILAAVYTVKQHLKSASGSDNYTWDTSQLVPMQPVSGVQLHPSINSPSISHRPMYVGGM